MEKTKNKTNVILLVAKTSITVIIFGELTFKN
jgi:hypothetical protein